MLHTRAGQRRVPSPGAQSCPSCPRPCRLHKASATLGEQFVDVVDELEAEDDVVANDEVDAHAVQRALLDGELAHFLLVVVPEVQLDVSTRTSLTHQLDSHDFHLRRLVLLQLILLDVPQQTLLVLLQSLIVFVLN